MRKSITIISVGVSLLFSCAAPKGEKIEAVASENPSEELPEPSDRISSSWHEINFEQNGYIDSMAYAKSNNFTEQIIYPCARCFTRTEVAEALEKARIEAAKINLQLVLFDCYRPSKFQQKMFDIIGDPRYVAEPKQGGSMHNKGLALDIALADAKGNLLEFGGDFDEFTERSHLNFEGLDSLAKFNRGLLKNLMLEAGFSSYEFEWWHYNYDQVDYAMEDFVWECDE